MKNPANISKLILLIAVFAVRQNYAQNTNPQYNNEFRLGAWQLVKGGLHMNYERFIGNQSVVWINEITYLENSRKKITGYFTEVQYRFYMKSITGVGFMELDREGFYVAPAVKYRFKKIERDGYEDNITTVGANLIMGFKYSIFEVITVDLNFGGAIISSDVNAENPNRDYQENMFCEGYSGVMPTGNLTIGVRF